MQHNKSMWKLLYQLASPKRFYDLSRSMTPWILGLGAALLTLGLYWGLFLAPADYQQGDAFRIIYVHVPSAFLSMACYGAMGFLSVLTLVWGIKLSGIMLQSMAQIGAWMTFLALITGCLWGKPMWGAFWVWDARLTSELILLFLYLTILATAHAFENASSKDSVLAILCLIGLIDLPLIHYSVYWWNTLHQGATLSLFAKPKIHPSMLYPLLLSLLGLALCCAYFVLKRARQDLLWRERRQTWVKALIQGGL